LPSSAQGRHRIRKVDTCSERRHRRPSFPPGPVPPSQRVCEIQLIQLETQRSIAKNDRHAHCFRHALCNAHAPTLPHRTHACMHGSVRITPPAACHALATASRRPQTPPALSQCVTHVPLQLAGAPRARSHRSLPLVRASLSFSGSRDQHAPVGFATHTLACRPCPHGHFKPRFAPPLALRVRERPGAADAAS
jgi:hypothetical protein